MCNNISPQVQSDLISCVGGWIRKQIIQDAITAQFFLVSADEAVDCSNEEQVPWVLRYVDEANEIQERFVDFVLHNTVVMGSAWILGAMEEYGLNMGSHCGQAYDGAGNMAGKLVLLPTSIQFVRKQCMCTVLHTHWIYV